jgi:hypothetical protein
MIKHIAIFEHAHVFWVHGNLRGKLLTEKDSIPDVVKITVCEQDQLEVTGAAALFVKLHIELSTGIGHPGIDQVKAMLVSHQVAVHMA